MEVSIKVNSSLILGFLAGVSAGIILCQNKKCCSDFRRLFRLPKYVQTTSNTSCCSASGTIATNNKTAGTDDDESKGVEEERAADRDCFLFTEGVTDVYKVSMTLTRILFDGRSLFQRVQVIETEQFGKTLVLDGQTQSAQADEFIYHESLVHPPMLLHPEPKTVFIGGGGEFATAREVLRHKSVERCVMIDIDKLGCDMCREHLPEWNAGCYSDSRLHVEYLDARVWLEQTNETFDVIIMDICDPIEAGPGYKLYTQEFYTFVQSKLNPGGIFITQSGPCANYNAKDECFTVINNTMASAFDTVVPYSVDVPSFGCLWGFNMAFASSTPSESIKEIYNTDMELFDERIAQRITGGAGAMKFLDGLAFRGLFGLTKQIRDECKNEDRVMTIDNPVFMYSS